MSMQITEGQAFKSSVWPHIHQLHLKKDKDEGKSLF